MAGRTIRSRPEDELQTKLPTIRDIGAQGFVNIEKDWVLLVAL